MMWVDPLMLQVTKKIQFDENIMSWWKYYKLTIILRVDKSTVSWGKLKAVLKKYEKSIQSAQMVKSLKIAYFEKMSILCLYSTSLCAALETVLWSLIAENKLLKMQHMCTDLHILFKLVFAF